MFINLHVNFVDDLATLIACECCASKLRACHTRSAYQIVPVSGRGGTKYRGGGSSRELFRTFPYTISVNL